MAKPIPKNRPKARNNTAHASLETYFERIHHSLEDRDEEYRQLKKYMRVHEECSMLLAVEQALNIAADHIFEINLTHTLDPSLASTSIQNMNKKNTLIKNYLRGKEFSPQIQLLHEITKDLHQIVVHGTQIVRKINRCTELIPIIKSLLKMQDQEDLAHDPVLLEISRLLKENITEPPLLSLKALLSKQKTAKSMDVLTFEDLNDVSDKLIGLLNDKLLLIIGVSETLMEGIEYDPSHDVPAEQRLPDELRVLFLAMSTLDILQKMTELRDSIKQIFTVTKHYLQLQEHPKLDPKIKQMLKAGDGNVHEAVTQLAKLLQRFSPHIAELASYADPLNLPIILRMTHHLIYEKANRVWENPYQIS
ncbi:hypothetical protein [Thioflexithrix psekupsensis]|uniref:Uncharacterized protein n=1 Tax=Thioflexithrix psekupsensis TaxID=1570016 RepID=A0A251XAY0_9GAMM|nr:hypothetical protein [Thioflexithrix psekupsensis]OUD15519.1 hypothetical protein TPSD3_03085 [Thioflexithrix psekupsensis]